MKKLILKVKDYISNNKKTILNGFLTLLIFFAISVAAMVIFLALGIIEIGKDGFEFNVHVFDAFKDSWVGVALFIVLQLICTTLLCFLPGTTMMFIALGQVLYPNPWHAFFIVFPGVVASSTLMYLTGRFGGYKLCVKMLGEKDCEKAITLLRNKGSVFFPFMMLFPMFPDDALVMIAGTLKMKLGWFFPSIIIGRGVGIATIIFGISIVPFEKFTEPWHWIVFVLVCAVGVLALFLGAIGLHKYLKKRNKE